MTKFTTQKSKRQEEFSIAWIWAIAAVAGYSVELVRVDNDSVDVRIMQKSDKDEYPLLDHLCIQLKCTCATKIIGDRFAFPLPLKNYNELRQERTNARILVLLHVPTSIGSWLGHTSSSVVLKNCAYWTSLRGYPSTKNKTSVTVDVPLKQKMTVDVLKQMMLLAANARMPEELL